MSEQFFFEEPEESDVVLAVNQRTKPLYPTHGPDGANGASWGEHFRRVKAPYREEVVEQEQPTILRAGALLAEPLKAPGAPGTLARRLAEAGWDVKVGASLAHMPAVLYVSDSDEGAETEYRRGDVRFVEHDLETVCLLGVKRAPNGRLGFAVDAAWTKKTGGSYVFVSAMTHDPIIGREYRSTVKVPRKPREWEKAEQVAPPVGLEQWLAMVCPKPKKEEK